MSTTKEDIMEKIASILTQGTIENLLDVFGWKGFVPYNACIFFDAWKEIQGDSVNLECSISEKEHCFDVHLHRIGFVSPRIIDVQGLSVQQIIRLLIADDTYKELRKIKPE